MLQALDPVSRAQWPGSLSAKFTGSRRHITVPDSIQEFAGAPLPILGRRHFEDTYDIPKVFKSSLKLYPQHNKESTLYCVNQDKKHYEFNPQQKKPRAERKHSEASRKQAAEQVLKGIKVFECNNKPSEGAWGVEQAMQQKTRVRGLLRMRNGIPLSALGDKIYKHPDYSRNFFKGLEKKGVPKKRTTDSGIAIVHFDKNAMTWKQRKEVEGRREDELAVEELFKWEENVLAEANPNWKDVEKIGPPDLFAEREKAAGGKKPEPAGKKK